MQACQALNGDSGFILTLLPINKESKTLQIHKTYGNRNAGKNSNKIAPVGIINILV
jgi:hypothetical protein